MILNPLLWLLQQNHWQNLSYFKSFSFYFNNEIIILKHLSCNRRWQFLPLLMLTGLTMPYLHCNHFCDFSISPVSLHETYFLVWNLWYHVKNQFALILHTISKQQIQMQHSVMNKRQMMKNRGGRERCQYFIVRKIWERTTFRSIISLFNIFISQLQLLYTIKLQNCRY